MPRAPRESRTTACGGGQETCIGGQWINCNAPAPNADGTCVLNCNPAGDPPTPWEAFAFASYAADTPCAGARFVRYMDEYSLWVGAVLCNPSRYKLFLGTAKNGTFYQIGDYAGNGQDHCEMVNDVFSIPNEDDVQSGGCAACALGPLIFSDPGLGPVFSRAPPSAPASTSSRPGPSSISSRSSGTSVVSPSPEPASHRPRANACARLACR